MPPPLSFFATLDAAMPPPAAISLLIFDFAFSFHFRFDALIFFDIFDISAISGHAADASLRQQQPPPPLQLKEA